MPRTVVERGIAGAMARLNEADNAAVNRQTTALPDCSS